MPGARRSSSGRATATERAIVVTHGTDTMVRDRTRAGRRAALDDKTIVLTGAMVPYAFGSSDGLFNLGSALSFVQVLPPGVYIAMNGQHFPWDAVRKNTATGCLRSDADRVTHAAESKLPAVGTTIFTVMSRLAAELGAINLSQGFPDFDCDPELVDAVARHMRDGPQPVRADAGRAGAARGDRREVRGISTAGATIRKPKSRSRRAAPKRSSMRSPPSCIRATRPSSSNRATTRTCPAIELSGGVPIVVPLHVSGLRASTGTRVRGGHAANPAAHHQLAAQPDRRGAHADDIRELSALVSGTGIFIVSDEVYEHIIFDGVAAREHGAAYASSPRAASSSARSARPITRPAGRSATPSPRRR